MRIILKKADFSANNIGVASVWSIFTTLGVGASYSGPRSVDKGSSLSATVVIADGYTLNQSGLSIYMGNSDITSSATVVGNTVTINITNVSGNISINVPTLSGSGSETPVTTTWYINSLDQLTASGNDLSVNGVELQSSSSYAWAFQDALNDKLVGKTINTIEMYAYSGGSFHMGKYSNTSKSITDVRTITVSEINKSVKYTFDDITISDNEYFVWNNTTNTSSEASGYYVLKDKLDPLVVETSGWYQVKSSGLSAFDDHLLVFAANIGYTGASSGGSVTPSTPKTTTWYIDAVGQLESSGKNMSTGTSLANAYKWAFQDTLNNKLVGNTINRLKVYAEKPGTFSIGKYNNSTKSITDTRVINISETNKTVEYSFNDITINSGEYFVWNNTSDTSGEATAYYFLASDVNTSIVETSGWYQVSSSGLAAFGSHILVPTISIGYYG